MDVSELMNAALVHVDRTTPVEVCALRMDHLGVRHLLVVDADGRLCGAVTDALVQRYGTVVGGTFIAYDLEEGTTAGDLALVVDVVVGPDHDLASVLRLLVRTRQDFAAVVDEHSHPIGLVTEHDLLKVALLVVPDSSRLGDLPGRSVVTVGHAQVASRALALMVRHQIRHLPVTGNDGGVVGVVSYRDLVAGDVRQRPVQVDDVRSAGLITARADDTLVICAARMLEYRVGCLPVLDGRRVVGIVTRRDLMDAAATALEREGAPVPRETALVS